MRWLDVDGARDYVGTGRTRPSRKVIYGWVKAGLRVVRLGDTGRHMLFCTEWIDAFLVARADRRDEDEQPVPFQAKRRA